MKTLVLAIAGRLLAAVATLLGATALLLALLVLAPGDPIDLLPNADEVRPTLEAQWGFDRPAAERWALHLARLARLDLGTSLAYRPGAPVAEVLAGPAARSALLVGASLLLVTAWGTLLAFATAGRPSRARAVVQAVSITPVFLLAHAVVGALNGATWWAVGQGLLARPDWFALPDQPSVLRSVLAVVLLAVGSGALAEVHGEVEDALVRIRASAWVDAARARGQPSWPLVLRALVPPVAHTLANRAALLVGGAVVVEKVMLLNGAGAVLWSATLLRDYELALSIAVLAAALVAATRLLADGVRVVVDPRLREAL